MSTLSFLSDPFEQFRLWYADAQECKEIEMPEACCLSTIDPDGYPNGRIVLMRGFDPRGFVFFTNIRSVKGQSLSQVPRAALTFYWSPLDRQIRIQGDVTLVTEAEADDYFRSRPRISRLGAWASSQSQPLESREVLEARLRQYEEQFAKDADIPRPPYWTGYRVSPRKIEFWIERDYRLHDRFLYTRSDNGWVITRLYP